MSEEKWEIKKRKGRTKGNKNKHRRAGWSEWAAVRRSETEHLNSGILKKTARSLICNNLEYFVSTDRGFPLSQALLSAPLSLCLPPLHPSPQWCGGQWRRALRWRWGGWEGSVEHQGSLCSGCRAGGQEETTRRVRKLKSTMCTCRIYTGLQSQLPSA